MSKRAAFYGVTALLVIGTAAYAYAGQWWLVSANAVLAKLLLQRLA